MSRRLVLAVMLMSVVSPAAARGAIKLTIEDTFTSPLLPSTFALDVFAEGTDAENEQLFAYDLGLRLLSVPGIPSGVTFVAPYAQKPDTNFVFGSEPTRFAVSQDSDPSGGRIIINVENSGALVDVPTSPVKVATLLLRYDATQGTGSGRIVFDPNRTDFASGDPTRDPTITIDISDAGIISPVIPEPAAGAFAVAASAILLRRRRT